MPYSWQGWRPNAREPVRFQDLADNGDKASATCITGIVISCSRSGDRDPGAQGAASLGLEPRPLNRGCSNQLVTLARTELCVCHKALQQHLQLLAQPQALLPQPLGRAEVPPPCTCYFHATCLLKMLYKGKVRME